MLDVARRFSLPQRLIPIEDAWIWGWGNTDRYGVYLHPNDQGRRMIAWHVTSTLSSQNGSMSRQWVNTINNANFTSQTRFLFSNEPIEWNAQAAAQQSIDIPTHHSVCLCKSAAFEQADLPDAQTVAHCGTHREGDLVTHIEQQVNISDDFNLNPKKKPARISLSNTTDNPLTIRRGERISLTTGLMPFTTIRNGL
ncbi:hypothetical protein GA0061078_0760 [Bifidobacterium bohemicum]|uniref:Uncharacterized protein n=2 Tax=Bifidobacterium bohemicum TaxID=638617 RepID=A0A086ZKF0_9BIFI|nr:hypothetical protein [Bifidobacterium bohemicum]KFI47000.1 hypothetical protein BBOH_0475 [Bifidobacterium bohemicum DSM 22767]SCB87346.1 hypothetical protein GA0061078_0760 [Bifidobacterium bohemicum]